MADTAGRLLRLLSLLTVRRNWPGDELAGRMGVTPRTIRRDVGRLRDLGYQVSSVPGPAGGYELGAGSGLPPLLLDDEAAVAVALGLRAATGGAVAGMEEAAARAAAVIERVLPGRLRRRVDALQSAVVPLPAGTPPAQPAMLEMLALACRDGERLRFGYVDGAGNQTRRHVEPYRLVSTGRRWYLVARDLDRDDWRSFRLDRLDDPVPTGRRSRPADPPDAARFVSEGVAVGAYRWRARVLLEVPASEAAALVPPTAGVIEAVDEDRCLLISGSDHLDAIALHLAYLEVPFTPLEPPELRERCAVLAARLSRAASAGDPAG
ncbi:MAG TPA: WYL domain-containing protein [Streptosporangiaceae bacterium]|jgi:predicted DNA-binding transcriptional regulator YafY